MKLRSFVRTPHLISDHIPILLDFMYSPATSPSGTHWAADCDAVAPLARPRCCWWRQGMRAAERLAVAVAAVCSGPAPGQMWVL
jgi:hypothetical protein